MVSPLLARTVRLQQPVETILTMERAAQERWMDALAIAMERPREALGSAYLLGYVVECRLKASLGRANGLPLSADLRPTVRALGHDLTKLLANCLQTRGTNPLSPAREAEWRRRVHAVADAHAVDFRYRAVPVALAEMENLYENVEWIVEHDRELWI